MRMNTCESTRSAVAIGGSYSAIRAEGGLFTQGRVGVGFANSEVFLNGVEISHNYQSGVSFSSCSEAHLVHSRIVGNGRPWDSTGRTLYFNDADPELRNCTLLGNVDYPDTYAWQPPTGMAYIINSILWDNSGLVENLLPRCDVAFSNVQGGWDGPGNIDADPCFVCPGRWDLTSTADQPVDAIWIDGDYHLKSQAGRWDAGSESWVVDDVTSPCIDAGDPNSVVGDEPQPNGGRINLGAYGGTAQASKSHWAQ